MRYSRNVARPSPYVDAVTQNHRSDRYGITLIFLLLVVSASWVADLGADWLQYSLLIGSFTFVVIRAPLHRVNSRAFLAFSTIFLTVAVISSIRPDGYSASDFLFLIHISLGFTAALAIQRDHRQTFGFFVRIMYWLTVSSLLLFPLVFLFPQLITPVPDNFQSFFQETSNESRRFYTLFGITYFVSGQGVSEIFRNQSIFWEPGMFGFLNVVALAASDAIGGKRKEKAIHIVGVLSSFAPGAYALLSLYLGIRMVRGAGRGVFVSGLVVLFFAVIGASAVPLLGSIFLLFSIGISTMTRASLSEARTYGSRMLPL